MRQGSTTIQDGVRDLALHGQAILVQLHGQGFAISAFAPSPTQLGIHASGAGQNAILQLAQTTALHPARQALVQDRLIIARALAGHGRAY